MSNIIFNFIYLYDSIFFFFYFKSYTYDIFKKIFLKTCYFNIIQNFSQEYPHFPLMQ